MSAHLYSVRDLRFTYQLGRQRVEALRGVNVKLETGGFICFVGPSGSGKTTLLSVLGLIEPVQDGDVRFQDTSLKRLQEREKNRIRRTQLGFIFQTFHLMPILTAEENVEYFLAHQRLALGERKRRVEKALRTVGLWGFRRHKPLELSGGQRQRIAIARAIAKAPKVILADEPTASLDQATGKEIMECLKTLNQTEGITLILSSHDIMVQKFARTLHELRDGVVVSGSANAL